MNEGKSFSDLKYLFYHQCFDDKVFEGTLFNYEKIGQHALIYAEKNSKKLLNSYLKFPMFLIRLYLFMKGLGSKNKKIALKKYLLIDTGRIRFDKNGKPFSMYFDQIINGLGRDQVTFFSKVTSDSEEVYEYSFQNLRFQTNIYKLNSKDIEILKDIVQVLLNIKRKKYFSDLQKNYIYSAFHVFFEEYLLYNKVFSQNNVSEFGIFTTHYHNESLIAALRMNGIKPIEIQHGLISKNDIYYVYPKKTNHSYVRSLFADKILLYGEYWKSILDQGYEYENRSAVVGDYTFQTSPNLIKSLDKENIILVAAQKNLFDYYIAYVKKLSNLIEENEYDWRIILKLHPSEKRVNTYRQAFDQCNKVQLVSNEVDLYELLSMCKIQISIYSTTLYDGLGMGIVNFSLQNGHNYTEFSENLCKENIAFPLLVEEDPLCEYEKILSNNTGLDRSYYYSKFEPDFLLKQLSTD